MLRLIQQIKTEKKFLKIQTFDLSYFNGKSYFDDDRSQSCLIFQPISNTFTTRTGDTNTIIAWKFNGLLDKSIESRITPSNSFTPKPKQINNSQIAVELKVSYVKQDNKTIC